MFTHLGVPKVCSHPREVEFDSQDSFIIVMVKIQILQWQQPLGIFLVCTYSNFVTIPFSPVFYL